MKRYLTAAILSIVALSLGLALAATTVNVQIPFYSDATKPFFQKMAKQFEAQNPDVTINLQEATWDNLHQVLVTDISASKAPDISIIGTRYLPGYVSSNIVMALDFSSDFTGTFISAFLKPSTVNGKLYGLPWAASDRALVYNKDLFKKADISGPPKTWDELKADAQKISKLPGRYGFGMQGGKIEADVYYYYFLWGAGGHIITPDGKSGLSSPAALKALKYVKGLIDAKLTEPNVTSNGREDLRTLFTQGRLGMFIYIPPIIGYLKQHAPNINYGLAAIPYDTTPSTYAVTDTIAMFNPSVTGASDDEVAAAKKFLQFLYTPEHRLAYNKVEGFLPVLKAVSKDPYFANNEKLNGFVKLLPTAHFAPVIDNWEQIAQTTINMLQSVYLGKTQPQQALNDAAQKVNAILAK
jgi:multiple sugar transport system substrate-binding protein